MIDDYTISGINDTAASQNKFHVHMDTFAADVREFVRRCGNEQRMSNLMAKTYDLKSACRWRRIICAFLSSAHTSVNWDDLRFIN